MLYVAIHPIYILQMDPVDRDFPNLTPLAMRKILKTKAEIPQIHALHLTCGNRHVLVQVIFASPFGPFLSVACATAHMLKRCKATTAPIFIQSSLSGIRCIVINGGFRRGILCWLLRGIFCRTFLGVALRWLVCGMRSRMISGMFCWFACGIRCGMESGLLRGLLCGVSCWLVGGIRSRIICGVFCWFTCGIRSGMVGGIFCGIFRLPLCGVISWLVCWIMSRIVGGMFCWFARGIRCGMVGGIFCWFTCGIRCGMICGVRCGIFCGIFCILDVAIQPMHILYMFDRHPPNLTCSTIRVVLVAIAMLSQTITLALARAP